MYGKIYGIKFVTPPFVVYEVLGKNETFRLKYKNVFQWFFINFSTFSLRFDKILTGYHLVSGINRKDTIQIATKASNMR